MIIFFYSLCCLGFLSHKNVFCITFENTIQTSDIAKNHGYLIGYFTFTGKGVAGLKYSISPLVNASNLRLSIFPIAYDPYSNLKRISTFYYQSNCYEFYHKAIYNVKMVKTSDKVALGRFSGGFAVAVVLVDKYVCPPNLRQLNINEEIVSKTINIKIQLLNPTEEESFSGHLSASDLDVIAMFQFLLLLYLVMGIWTAYSVFCKTSVDIPLMLIIQKMACLIICIHIVIYVLLLLVYRRLLESGSSFDSLELMAEILAVISRYMGLYIVVSWTLSSRSDSGRTSNFIARVIGSCALLHTLLTAAHYNSLDNRHVDFGCSTVWDCESHIFYMGFGNPVKYDGSFFGMALISLNCLAGLGASMFVLHLLKLGLGITEFSVRRSYLSVFCSASLLWFWAYPTVWMMSGLVTDYYQYKFVVFMVSVCQLGALPAMIRVTMQSSIAVESNTAPSVTVYN